MYLESVDFTMFKCESSFLAINTLSNNAPRLRKVTLRSPEEFVYHTPDKSEDDKRSNDFGLSVYVSKLLKKTAITHLELVNFHDKSNIWSETQASLFLLIKSNSLESLILRSSSRFTESNIGPTGIMCPNLTEMKIIYKDSPLKCLLHMSELCHGLAAIVKSCPRLKWFNNMRVHMDCWYISPDDRIMSDRHGTCLCSNKCGLYDC